jgi:hypothetical protein
MLVAGRILARALAAGGAAAARELAAERDRRRAAELAAAQAAAGGRAAEAGRLRRVVGRCLYGLFAIAFVCLLLVALNIDMLLPAGWRPFFRVTCGGVLALAGLTLVGWRGGGRSLLTAQFVRPRPAGGTARASRRGWTRRMLDPLLQALGVLMLGGAAFELARAVPRLV